MSEPEAEVTEKRGISKIWAVPIVAVLIGAYMVFYTWQHQGPEITITFETAEGIEAGKTKIKTRNVDLGLVETVELSEGHDYVIVTAQLAPGCENVLLEDTQFWVVRPRIGTGGVSGLGTVLSGGYIELAPGVGEQERFDFVGIEEPPVTAVGTPGLHVDLWSDESISVSTSDPIIYKGFEVGRIESTEFEYETGHTRYRAFVQAPYDELITTSTRFWDMSGIEFSATADGVDLRTGSLQTLLIGGVSFRLPEGALPGEPVESGASFRLYPDMGSIDERPYKHYVEFVIQFDRSIRGLRPGAPVEYRGIHMGHVERLLLQEVVELETRGNPLPVLVRLEPGRLLMGDTEEGAARLEQTLRDGVRFGTRASLETGNLLTGSMYVKLDTYDDAPPAEVGEAFGYPSIPTISGGLEQIEYQLTNLLKKLNALPLDHVTRTADATLASANQTIRELERTLAEVRGLVADDDTRRLPGQVDDTLAELDATLRSLRSLVMALEQQPNALIFAPDPVPDPEPQAGTR